MRAADTAKPVRGRTRRRWLRLTCWGFFLVWLAWFAYARITTPPAAFTQQRAPALEDREQVADELHETVCRLPLAPAPTSAPAGFAWRPWDANVLTAGLQGPWSPDPNSAQDHARKYVSDPSTRKILDEIVALCARERSTTEEPSRPAQTPIVALSAPAGNEYEQAIDALVFRARYRAAENQDAAGALADLQAAEHLVGELERRDSVAPYWAEAIAILVQHELGCLAQEVELPPEPAREMIAFLRDELSLSVADAVIHAVDADQEIDHLLDHYYTDDGHGDGWLVLSAASDRIAVTFGYWSPPGARSRLWNMFSPLFNGRSGVRHKLVSLNEDLRQLDGLDFEAAKGLLASRAQSPRGGSVLDGPLIGMTQGIDEYRFNATFQRVVRRRALVVMLGLSAYKHEHAEYPDTLDALTPAYLAEVPLDVFTQQPFRYQKVSASEYGLGPARELPWNLFAGWWSDTPDYQTYLPRRTPKQP